MNIKEFNEDESFNNFFILFIKKKKKILLCLETIHWMVFRVCGEQNVLSLVERDIQVHVTLFHHLQNVMVKLYI